MIDNQLATLQVGDQVPIATRSAIIGRNRERAGRQQHRLSQHRHHPAGRSAREQQRQCAARHRAGDQQRRGRRANANTLTPTVSQRRVKSSISVASGQTVLLGGLIQERQERGRVRHSAARPDSDRWAICSATNSGGHLAHRAHHLHPAADHPRSGRCAPRRRGTAHAPRQSLRNLRAGAAAHAAEDTRTRSNPAVRMLKRS